MYLGMCNWPSCRHGITMDFASWTISPVPDIPRYVSECLVSSVSPRIFPGGKASPVLSPTTCKILTPLPALLHPQNLWLWTSATSQDAVTSLDPHVTTCVHHPSVQSEAVVDCITTTSAATFRSYKATLMLAAPDQQILLLQ